MPANFTVGQILTAAALNAAIDRHEPVEVVKPLDEGRTSTTTFAADAHLFVPLEASSKYDVDVWLPLLGSNTGDWKGRWTFPAGWAIQLWHTAPALGLAAGTDEGTGNFAARLADTTSPTSECFAGVTDTTNPVTVHERLRVVTNLTAGNLALEWAQFASNATATTIKAGAKIKAVKSSSLG